MYLTRKKERILEQKIGEGEAGERRVEGMIGISEQASWIPPSRLARASFAERSFFFYEASLRLWPP